MTQVPEVIEIPNIRSAEKRMRQNEKRWRLNRTRKIALKSVIRQIRLHLASQDKESARSLLPELAQAADKAARHHTIHKNKASRIKSRWTKKVESL
ncbi:MAG TPA: 30S ribosomal protein S20 [Candidatus Acetothermia bacterium]|nr:30S ribosomal protein S20 [Candidatus Acetothermia bacterium]